jgi:predicted DNA-binding transcriptional regulator AlpA
MHSTQETGARAVEAGPTQSLPIREREAVTALTAAQFIGISRTRIYELLQDGTLEGRVIRGRRVVLVRSLLRLIGESPTTKRRAA